MKKLSALLMVCSTNLLLAYSQHVYVADSSGTSVQVIDIESISYHSIFGFNKPHVVKVTPDGRQAYVGELDGSIRIIDTITHTILPTVIPINQPIAMAISPDNTFFCVVSHNNTMTVVRSSDLTVLTVMTGFDSPQDVKISPDSMFAYVTNQGNGTVNVIRTADWVVVDTIAGMKKPVGLALTNDGAYAYVTDPTHGVLYQLRFSDNTLVNTVVGFDSPQYLGMTPDDNFMYVSDHDINQVVLVRLLDNQIINSFHIPTPKSVAITPDGLTLFVGSTFGTLYQVRILDQVILDVYPGGPTSANPSNLAMTIDNAPEVSLNGCQISTSVETYNHITWLAAPGNPTGYTLYRDAQLTKVAATLNGAMLTYDDHDRQPGQTYWYYLVAHYANGFSSQVGDIKVTPTRTCLGGL